MLNLKTNKMSQKLNTTTRQIIKDLQNNKAFQKSADLIRKSLKY